MALPKGLLGTAIGYPLGLWPQLTTFLEDGHIPIDNNVTENAIRPFVAGRLLFPRRGRLPRPRRPRSRSTGVARQTGMNLCCNTSYANPAPR